jgi:hypothetical protein
MRIRLFVRCSPDQPPNDDTKQGTHKSGDQILKGDLDFAETQIDVEQPKKKSAHKSAQHSDAHVGPEPEPLLAKSHETTGQRSSQRSNDQPDNEFRQWS